MEADALRIKLAEAMGWKRVTLASFGGLKSDVWESIHGVQAGGSLPDPFTDTNDDYAVLEWMHTFKNTSQHRMWGLFVGNDIGMPPVFKFRSDYQIGDYARAACKVLRIDYEV